jgi:hypothetical protein
MDTSGENITESVGLLWILISPPSGVGGAPVENLNFNTTLGVRQILSRKPPERKVLCALRYGDFASHLLLKMQRGGPKFVIINHAIVC